eukprot:XP_020393794.1 vegetative cell wall protein gp1-like [Zea mays]
MGLAQFRSSFHYSRRPLPPAAGLPPAAAGPLSHRPSSSPHQPRLLALAPVPGAPPAEPTALRPCLAASPVRRSFPAPRSPSSRAAPLPTRVSSPTAAAVLRPTPPFWTPPRRVPARSQPPGRPRPPPLRAPLHACFNRARRLRWPRVAPAYPTRQRRAWVPALRRGHPAPAPCTRACRAGCALAVHQGVPSSARTWRRQKPRAPAPDVPATPPDSFLVAARVLLDGPPRSSRRCASPTSGVPTHIDFMASPPPVALVTVRVLLHDGQLIRGMFVSFDPVWNPILRDCVEVHPQAGRHVPGPLVFPRAAIASLAVEPVSSPSLPTASVRAPSLALSAHTVPSPLPPPRTTTDWVVDSGASFHTTPTTNSLLHSHPPHPSHPTSIVVGNGSTLPVTSVPDAVHARPCSSEHLYRPNGATTGFSERQT